jgi:hypothetical protein
MPSPFGQYNLAFLSYANNYYGVQSYANPQEYDPPRVQPTIPDYSIPNPNWPFTPYQNKDNPNYPGYYAEAPIYTLPSVPNSWFTNWNNVSAQTDYTKDVIVLRTGSNVCTLSNKAQIIYNNNATYNENYEPINPIYGIVEQCQFRIGQLINVTQRISPTYDFGGTFGISPFPAYFNPNSDPETWLVTFNVPKNTCFVGQGVYLNNFFSGNASKCIIKTISSYDDNYDTVEAKSLSSFIDEGSPPLNRYIIFPEKPLTLKAQIIDIVYDANVESDKIGEIRLYFETYEIVNGDEQYSTLSNMLIEWQHNVGFDYGYYYPSYGVERNGQNFIQNENFAARQGYAYTQSNIYAAGRCSYNFYNYESKDYITSDTDFLKSGYTEEKRHSRWFLIDDDEANRPWNGVKVSVDYKLNTTDTTTTYYYPNLDLYPPDYVVTDDYSETNVIKTTENGSISKTFINSDFDINSPNYIGNNPGPGAGYCYGDENDVLKYRSGQYEYIWQIINFRKWINTGTWENPSGYWEPYPYRMIVSTNQKYTILDYQSDPKYYPNVNDGVQYGIATPESFLP